MAMIKTQAVVETARAVGTANRVASKQPSGVAWGTASAEFTRRSTIFTCYGDTGTGRTSLLLTAPGPIALLHAAEKVDGIFQQAVAKGKEVRMFNFGGTFRGSEDQIAQQADAKFREFYSALLDAKSWARTVIIDTHTELWELLRLARFGKTAQIKPHHYGPVNAEWISLLKLFRDIDVNLLLSGQMREQYRNDKPTGVLEQAGQKGMGYLPDVVVRTEKRRVKRGGSTEQTFVCTVEKAWMHAEYEGTELEDGDIQFPSIMGMVTETDPGEWEQ